MFEYDQEIVKSLLSESRDFKRLYDKHGVLERKLDAVYSKSDRIDDITLGKLKKKKLYIKDKMATFVEQYRHAHPG